MSEIKTALSVFQKDETKQKFQEILGKKSAGFITSVLAIISQSEMLKDSDPNSVYLAAMTAATLDLPINQNLGFAYILPYKGKDGTKAQFQIWYKGLIQLAQRSGQFKTISACPVHEWQILEENPLTWFIFDFKNKKSDKVIGYASYFSLINGFEKTMYMTVEELQKHWSKFSQSFKKWYWLWKDDFDSMAIKTVLKLLLSKFAPLSIEMQKAVVADQAIIEDENLDIVDYIDNDQEAINAIDLDEALADAWAKKI